MTPGRVSSIFLAPAKREELTSVAGVMAFAGRGLAGDRYFSGEGSFSRWPDAGRAVSLIEQEVIDAVLAEHGVDLSAGRHRRNIVTIGVRLAGLNGRRFRIGSALFRGARLCAPCKYLQRLVGPGTFDALRGRGGLRADIWETGEIAVGDAVTLIDEHVRLQHSQGI